MDYIKEVLREKHKVQVAELISEVAEYTDLEERKKILNESISRKIESIDEIGNFIGEPFVNVNGQQLMVSKLTRSATDILKM